MRTDLAPLPPPPGKTPQDIVDAIADGAKSSFALGMKLLSRPRRQAMRAVYAFCRVVDDIADGDLPAPEKRALLAQWREEVEQIFAGDAISAIGRALSTPVRKLELPKEEFILIIEGMEMDADGPIVAPSHDQLMKYTRRAAGAVGILSMHVFGAWRGEVSERFALALADALQITNILRDVEEDARIGRIYLPSDCLQAAGLAPEPMALPGQPGLVVARASLAEDARAAFETARQLIPAHNRRALIPALAMYGVYRAYFQSMERSGWLPGSATRMGRLAKLRHGLAGIVAP